MLLIQINCKKSTTLNKVLTRFNSNVNESMQTFLYLIGTADI